MMVTQYGCFVPELELWLSGTASGRFAVGRPELSIGDAFSASTL